MTAARSLPSSTTVGRMNSGRSRRTPSRVVNGRRFRSSAAVNRSDLAVLVWRNFAAVSGGWGPGSGDGPFAPAHTAHTRIPAIAKAVLVVIPTLQLMWPRRYESRVRALWLERPVNVLFAFLV